VGVLATAALVLAAGSAVFLAVVAGRHTALARGERRYAALAGRLRPVALEIVEGEREVPPPLTKREELVLAELLGVYARALRGDVHVRLGAYFEARGTVDLAVRALSSRRPSRRARAAFVLGHIGTPRVAADLSAALHDPTGDVRTAAARSLGRLGVPETAGPLLACLVDRRVPRLVIAQALLTIGRSAVPQLRELASHPDAPERAGAFELIGLLGEAGDAGVVLRGLRDTSAEVRERAALALGRIGAAEANDALRAALDDRVPAVRAAAAVALGLIGDRGAVDPLVVLAREDSFEPARAAARAVRRIAPDRLEALAAEPGAGAHLAEAADLEGVE
jgi:HEAT repeat protein